MVRLFLRLTAHPERACDLLVLYLQPDFCLDEAKVLIEALKPLHVNMSIEE